MVCKFHDPTRRLDGNWEKMSFQVTDTLQSCCLLPAWLPLPARLINIIISSSTSSILFLLSYNTRIMTKISPQIDGLLHCIKTMNIHNLVRHMFNTVGEDNNNI